MKHLFLISIVAVAQLPAADINGPVSGFILDRRVHALRPVNGLPGSATQGNPLRLRFAVGLAAISARLDYALVTDAAGDGTPKVALGLRNGAPQFTAVDSAISADRIVLSDSGDVAALYSNRSSRLQFITGLPAQPQAGDPIDTSSLASGLAALALDPQGLNALAAAGDGGIYWIGRRTAPKWIAQMPGAASAAFLANGTDAVIGSRSSGDVLLFRDPGGSLSISTLTGARDGISSAVAVRPIGDSEVAVVDGTGRVAAVDVNSSTINWVALAGAADRLETLGGGLLVLNETGSQPLLLLDTSQGRAAYFVPPLPGLHPPVSISKPTPPIR
jgi:hypothetical protein